MKKFAGIILIVLSIVGFAEESPLIASLLLIVGIALLFNLQGQTPQDTKIEFLGNHYQQDKDHKIIQRRSKDKVNKQKFTDYIATLPKQTPRQDVMAEVTYCDSHIDIFKSFVSNTTNSLDIITHDFSEKILVDLLNHVRNKKIGVRIITYSINDRGYLEPFTRRYPNISVQIRKLKNIHSKLIIRDSEKAILGSSNLDNASLNNNYEINVCFDEGKDVHRAKEIFDSLWTGKDIIKKEIKSNLVFSNSDESGLPLYLKRFFEDEKEVTIIMNLNAIDKEVIDTIKSWNKKLKIKLVTGSSWTNQPISKNKIESFRFLKSTFGDKKSDVQVIPRNVHVHAKTYLFKKQKIVFVSSQNLTKDSWRSELETGYLLKNENQLNNILKSLERFGEGRLQDLNFIDTSKPDSKWITKGGEFAVSKVPWMLLEEKDPTFLPKEKVWTYFKLIRDERKKKGEREQGKSQDEITISEEERIRKYNLYKRNSTTRYPKFTKGPLFSSKKMKKSSGESELIKQRREREFLEKMGYKK